MSALYNEIDPYCAQWLRNLIKEGLIPNGIVDERDIRLLQPADLEVFVQVHLFAGLGGWPYAARLAGWPDDRPLWTGSCPCQPFSVAGKKKGFADERDLWPDFARLIGECRPPIVVGEQVHSKDGKLWLDRALAQLEGDDYACWAAIAPACGVEAPHLRYRLWFVAHAASEDDRRSDAGESFRHLPQSGGGSGAFALAHADGSGRRRGGGACQERARRAEPTDGSDGPLAHAAGQQMGSAGQPWQPRHVGAADLPTAGRHGGSLPCAQGEGGRERRASGSLADGFGYAGFWDDARWVYSPTEDKRRRVKPGISLLAPRLPGHLAQIRAFGNAITPQVGAEILRAVMEMDG